MDVTRILIVAGLEREGSMHQIQIDRVQSESVQAGLQRRSYPLRAMVVVPELRGHEQILTTHRSLGQHLNECCANLCLISVPLCTIDVAEPDLHGRPS